MVSQTKKMMTYSNCQTRNHPLAIKYNSKGKVIDKMIYPDYNLDVIPETIMETIYEFACE